MFFKVWLNCILTRLYYKFGLQPIKIKIVQEQEMKDTSQFHDVDLS